MSVKGADGKRRITMAEVEQHASDTDAWIVVKDKVYDCTPFLDKHPGGSASITMNAGTDCTEDFVAVHSAKAWKDLEEFYIGDLVSEADIAAAPPSAAAPPPTDPGGPRCRGPRIGQRHQPPDADAEKGCNAQ